MRRPSRLADGLIVDVLPVVLLIVLGLLDVRFGLSSPYGHAPKWTAVPPQLLACTALLFRRRRPITVLVLTISGLAVPGLFGPVMLTFWGQFVPWLVAVYSVGRHVPWARTLWAIPLSCAGYSLALLLFPPMRVPGDVLFNGVVIIGLWGIGRMMASVTASRRRSLVLEFERGQAEERAATAERTRIARELHDVISHTITVIVMQAGGARMAAAADPRAAVEALSRIEDLGRDSLLELRTLLRVLRSADGIEIAEVPARVPQPGLTDVPRLCSTLRGTGMRIDLTMTGDPRAPAAGAQLTAFRVVQEALTNVLKHSTSTSAEVRVAVGAERLSVVVANTVGRSDSRFDRGGLLVSEAEVDRGGAEAGPGGGRQFGVETDSRFDRGTPAAGSWGLAGLRERLDALGGTLVAGPDDRGRYTVRAIIPLTGAGEAP